MSKTFEINPSVATTVNINPIIVGEENVPIIFTFDEEIEDEFEVNFWNSFQKNDEVTAIGELIVENAMMTLELTPTDSGIVYYEIMNITSNRVYFKGNITVLK